MCIAERHAARRSKVHSIPKTTHTGQAGATLHAMINRVSTTTSGAANALQVTQFIVLSSQWLFETISTRKVSQDPKHHIISIKTVLIVYHERFTASLPAPMILTL